MSELPYGIKCPACSAIIELKKPEGGWLKPVDFFCPVCKETTFIEHPSIRRIKKT